MKKNNWIKFWTRDFGLFRYWLYIESNKLDFYKKNFGVIFDYALTVPDGKLVAYYHDRDELEKVTNKMYEIACCDFKTFTRFSKQVLGYTQEFIDFNKKINSKKISNLSDKQLLKFYDTWYKKYLYWQTGIYFFFVLEPIITDQFLVGLKNYLKEQNQLDKLTEYTEIVMSPEKMNAIILEQYHTLRVAIKIKSSPKQKQALIKKLYQKFLWIPCYDVHFKEYDIKHFQAQIAKLGKLPTARLENMAADLQTSFKNRKIVFNGLIKKIKNKKLVELAKIMHWLVYYKDFRDDLRRQTGHFGKLFMEPLAKKLNLDLVEINYLTSPEIRSCIVGKRVSKDKIKSRIPSGYVFKSTKNKTEIYVGADIKKIITRELALGANKQTQEIKGIVASVGKAQGRVVIIRHTINLNKVKPGDIMVAVTTHPDYLPAMKKCKAIVTDEGGVTSHAAIVSRELGIPCIVGTKVATQVLKDGDRVEVDAKSGIIKTYK